MSAPNTLEILKRIPDIEEGKAQAIAGAIARIDEMVTKRDFRELRRA